MDRRATGSSPPLSAFAVPHERGWLLIPGPRGLLKPGPDLLGAVRVLPVQRAALEHTLDRLRVPVERDRIFQSKVFFFPVERDRDFRSIVIIDSGDRDRPGDGSDGAARWQSAPERAVSLLCPRRRDARRETAHAPPSRTVAASPCRPAATCHRQKPWPRPRHREQVPEPSPRRRPELAFAVRSR